jgi:hypothetical protein
MDKITIKDSMDEREQLDRILIDYNLGNIKRHKAREKICMLFNVVGSCSKDVHKSLKEKKKMPFLRKILKGLKDEKITMSKALEMIND